MGKKSVRVNAGFIGGGVTNKATRPTGVLTLTRQKEPTGEFLPDPPSPVGGMGALTRKRSLPAGTNGINTRRSPAFSASLSAVRCCPAGAVSSSACPGLTLRLCGVAFGHSPGVLCEHKERALSAHAALMVSHRGHVKTKLRRTGFRYRFGLDVVARDVLALLLKQSKLVTCFRSRIKTPSARSGGELFARS